MDTESLNANQQDALKWLAAQQATSNPSFDRDKVIAETGLSDGEFVQLLKHLARNGHVHDMLKVDGGKYGESFLLNDTISAAVIPKAPADETADSELKPQAPEFLSKLHWVITNWKNHWKLYTIAALLILALAFAPFFLGDIASAIKKRIAAPPPVETVTLPDITVKLLNSGTEPVEVSYRGDFYLWLPGLDGRHAIGKYELLNEKHNTPEGGIVTIHPNTTVTMFARILNPAKYRSVLEQEECTISLFVNLRGGDKFTNDMPFTIAAIEKHYLEADVARNASNPP